MSLLNSQVLAKGGSYSSEDRYNPQHIESLPREISDAVIHCCSTPIGKNSFLRLVETAFRAYAVPSP